MSVSNSTVAEYLGIEQKQIIKRRDDGDSVIVLVDEGIGGIKKHAIPPSALAVPVKLIKKESAPPTLETPQENKTPIASVGLPQNALDALYRARIRYLEDMPDDLTSIKGIGAKTAEAVKEILTDD